MLYSIGKDSLRHAASGDEGVLSRQAALSAAACRHHLEIPRDDRISRRRARELGLDLIVHINRGRRCARASIRSRTAARMHTDVMKTEALEAGARQVPLRCGVRRRAPRRRKAAAKERVYSFRDPQSSLGPARISARNFGTSITARSTQARDPRLPAVQLDRTRYLAIHLPGKYPHRAALLCQGAAGGGARRRADHGGRRPHAARCRAKSRRCDGSASARWAAIR